MRTERGTNQCYSGVVSVVNRDVATVPVAGRYQRSQQAVNGYTWYVPVVVVVEM